MHNKTVEYLSLSYTTNAILKAILKPLNVRNVVYTNHNKYGFNTNMMQPSVTLTLYLELGHVQLMV